MDTRYLRYNSPFGAMGLYSNGDALTVATFEADAEESDSKDSILEECRRQLDLYFKGKLKQFDIPLAPQGTPFQKSVWESLSTIPYGKTISYKEQSIKIGNLKAIRAVASANGKNPIAIIIPCHRVIGSDGSLTGYAGGLHLKKHLLDLERNY